MIWRQFNLRERDHLGDLDVDGRIILYESSGSGRGGDWMELALGRDRCRALVNMVMNLRVPCYAGNFLTSCKPVSFSRRTLLHGVSK